MNGIAIREPIKQASEAPVSQYRTTLDAGSGIPSPSTPRNYSPKPGEAIERTARGQKILVLDLQQTKTTSQKQIYVVGTATLVFFSIAMQTYAKNPGRTFKKIESILSAWEKLAPEARFSGMDVATFRGAMRPSEQVRERILELESELQELLNQRVLIDKQCHEMAIKVVSSVRGTPEFGPNSPLYVAMGYIPDKEKKVGRPKKSEQSTTKKTFQDPEPPSEDSGLPVSLL